MVGYVGSAIKQPAAENEVLRYNQVSPAFWSPVCNQMQVEWKGMVTRYAAVKTQLCIMMLPLYLSVSLLFTYLCNFSPMRNTSLSRATPPSWPTKDSLMGRGGFCPLWTHGHFTEQPKHLIMKESETSNQCLHFARLIQEHAHSLHGHLTVDCSSCPFTFWRDWICITLVVPTGYCLLETLFSNFTTALTYFRIMANYLITDSQCSARKLWYVLGRVLFFFFPLYRVYQITVLSPCPWTE